MFTLFCYAAIMRLLLIAECFGRVFRYQLLCKDSLEGLVEGSLKRITLEDWVNSVCNWTKVDEFGKNYITENGCD